MLTDQIALVTGASRGIGQAIARALGAEQATVIGTATSQAGADSISEALAQSGARGCGMVLDVGDPQSISECLKQVVELYGAPDILVNNAGITNIGDILETPLAEVEDVLTVNLKAPFMMIKAVLPHMLKQKSGSVVNNASDQALIGKRYSAIYGASKAALAQLTKSAALDWGPHGIRFNCIAPGSTDTPMLRRVLSELHERYPGVYPQDSESFYKESIALKRFAASQEIAWLVAFLASEASSFMTGTLIPIDGGFTAQ